jgi:tetratricopeptide (TPR) repeat protein
MGNVDESIRLWEQAVAADSNFAMAWRKLSVALFNQGGDRERQFAAAQRAYDLRERLPQREADLATAYYFQTIGRRPEAIDAYQRMLATWPDDIPARNNLALLLNAEFRYGESERMLRTAIDSGTASAAIFDNLIDAQLFQQKYAAAESTVARYGQTVPEARGQRQYFSTIVAFSRGRFDDSRAVADSLRGLDDANWREFGTGHGVRTRILGGQLQQALAIGTASDAGAPGPAGNGDRLDREATIALVEGVVHGQVEAAGRRLAEAVARYPLDSVPLRNRDYPSLIFVAASLERPDLVARLETEYRQVPKTGQFVARDDARVRASVAAANGRWPEVIEQARQSARTGFCPVCPLPEIGHAFDQLRQPDSALAAYEEYVNRLIYYPADQEVFVPVALVRLGELYESKGNREKAIEYYGRFADLWKDADPELQPRVAEVRKRIAQLAAEPGARP